MMNQKEIDRAIKAMTKIFHDIAVQTMTKTFHDIAVQTMLKKEEQEVRKALQSPLDKKKKAHDDFHTFVRSL